MKVALASEDGRTISAHFGHCACFIIITVEDGKVAATEIRSVSGDGAGAQHRHGQEHHHGHGHGACHCHGAQGHAGRMPVLEGCDAVVSLGMGPRAAEHLKALGIRPVVLAESMEPAKAALLVAEGGFEEQEAGAKCCCHGG